MVLGFSNIIYCNAYNFTITKYILYVYYYLQQLHSYLVQLLLVAETKQMWNVTIHFALSSDQSISANG